MLVLFIHPPMFRRCQSQPINVDHVPAIHDAQAIPPFDAAHPQRRVLGPSAARELGWRFARVVRAVLRVD